MTIQTALSLARVDDLPNVQWREVEKTLLAARICPSCACDGYTVALGPFEPGNAWEYSGRSCPQCEEFYPDRQRGEFDRSDYGGVLAADGCVYSDADSGL